MVDCRLPYFGSQWDESDPQIYLPEKRLDAWAETRRFALCIMKKHGNELIMRWQQEEAPEYIEGNTYTKREMTLIADEFLRDDVRREICRKCHSEQRTEYGEETGRVEQRPLFNKDKSPVLDDDSNHLYGDFPEYECIEGHRWFLGEGRSRGIGGENPILFEEHIQARKKREIICAAGTPDPEIVSGLYNRCVDSQTEALTPSGWKTYDQLEIAQPIWAYDLEFDTHTWVPLQGLFVNKAFDGLVATYESDDISACVTNGHRWPVVHRDDDDFRFEARTLLTTGSPLHLNEQYLIRGVSARSWVSMKSVQQDTKHYQGIVWCPQVATGFWMARRNGKVYTTGNSHPQGRKVNSEEARTKHGSSYYR